MSGSDLTFASADGDRWLAILPANVAIQQTRWERMMRIHSARMGGARIVDIARYLGLSPVRVAQIIHQAQWKIERARLGKFRLKSPADTYFDEKAAVASACSEMCVMSDRKTAPVPPADFDLFEAMVTASTAPAVFTIGRDALSELVAYVCHLESNLGKSRNLGKSIPSSVPSKFYLVIRKPSLMEDEGRPEFRGVCSTRGEAESYVMREGERSRGYFSIRDMQIIEVSDLENAAVWVPEPDGIFRSHSCWKCQDGRKPCVEGHPNRCGFPHAKND